MTVENRARIKWACRRGMLELDVMIMPFFETCFDILSPEEKGDFVALLDADDPDLFAWLMGYAKCQNLALSRMVDKIVSHNLAKLH